MTSETWPPSTLPDLGAPKEQSTWLAVRRYFNDGGSKEPAIWTYQVNAVRLIDAAIRDYLLARECVLRFHSRDPGEMGIGLIIESTSHFESCIWHLDRAVRHLQFIRKRIEAEKYLKDALPRGMELLNTEVIREVRNAISHLEREAFEGRLPPGKNVALSPQRAGLRVGDYLVEWSVLAGWLEAAKEVAAKIAR